MSAYEFSKAHNKIILKVGQRLQYVGILFALICVANFIDSFARASSQGFAIEVIPFFINAALSGVAAFIFYRPSDNFKRIVTTTGSDIPELMTALSELRQGFIILVAVLVIGVLNAAIARFVILG